MLKISPIWHNSIVKVGDNFAKYQISSQFFAKDFRKEIRQKWWKFAKSGHTELEVQNHLGGN